MSTSTPADKPRLTEEEKKSNHIASEQKRRQAIRQGFDRLASIVPGMEGQGRSEAIVLEATVKYLKEQYTLQQKLVAQIKARGIDLSDLELPEGYLEAIENPVAQNLLAAEDDHSDDKAHPLTAAKRRRSMFSVVPGSVRFAQCRRFSKMVKIGKDLYQECRKLERVQKKQAPKMCSNNRSSSHTSTKPHPTTVSDVTKPNDNCVNDSCPDPVPLDHGIVSKFNLTSNGDECSSDQRLMEPVYLSELDEYVQQLVSNCPDIEKSMDSMPEPVGVSQLPASDLPTVHPSLPQAQSSVNFMFQNTIVPWNAKPTGLENVVSLLSKLSITSKAIYSTLDADEDAGLAMEANQCSHPLALSDLEEMRGHIGQIATSLQDLEKLWWGLEKKGSCTRQFRERISFLTGQAIEKNWPETKENAAARSQDSAQFGGIPNLNHEVSAVSLGNPSGFPMVDPKTTIRLVPQSAEDFDPFVGSGPFDIEGSLTIPQSASGRDPFVRSSSFDTGGSLDPFVSSGPFDTNGSLVYLPGPRSTQGLTGMPAFRGSEYGGSNFMATSFGRSSTNLLSDFLHSENVRTEAPAEVPGSEHTSVAQTDRTEKFAHENGALAPKRQPRSKKVADKDLSPPLRRSGRSKGKSTSATTPANNRKKGPGRGKRPNSKMPSKQTQSVTTAVNDSAPETEQQPFASSQDMADSGLRRSTRIRNLLAPSSTTPMQTVATETRNSSLMGSGNSTTTTSGTVRKRAATRPPSTPGSANKRGRTRRTSSMNNFEEASGVSDTYDAGGYSSFGRTSAFNNNQGTGDADTFGRPNVGNSVGSYNGSNSFDSLGGSMTTSSANGFNRDLVSPFGPPRPSSPRGTLEAYARIQAARQAISTVHDAEGNTQPWNKVLSAEEMRTLKGPLSWSPQKENDTAPPGT